MTAYSQVYGCRLTARDRDQPRNPYTPVEYGTANPFNVDITAEATFKFRLHV